MSTIPPNLLSALMPYGDAIASRLQGSSRSKQATTDRARQDHYLAWCHAHGIPAGGTKLAHIQARNFVIACYAVSLTTGETLLSKKVRHDTLRGYVRMAIKCHTDLHLPSPRKADSDFVAVILDAVKKYETVPRRREMIHDSMFEHLLGMYQAYKKKHPDALTPALIEWLLLSRWVGPRKSEWCSDSPTTYKTIDDPEWGNRPKALPFIFDDFVFTTKGGQRVVIPESTWSNPAADLPRDIEYLEITVRKQKNNDNYQKLTYGRVTKRPLMCPVRAAFHIWCRGQRLGLPGTYPAAVYSTSTHHGEMSHRLITGEDCNRLLRRVAMTVFKLKPTSPDLKLWSTHSLRVTACNLLHRAKFSDSYIKNRLRWRSDSFLMYLRNTFYTADEHVKALDLEITPSDHEQRALEQHEILMSQAACASAA